MRSSQKPFGFTTTTDPQNRCQKFLATKMGIVDIYPCRYVQGMFKALANAASNIAQMEDPVGSTVNAGKTAINSVLNGSSSSNNTTQSGSSPSGSGMTGQGESSTSSSGSGSLGENTPTATRFKYTIEYETAMQKYRELCQFYLKDVNPPSAVRIFTTENNTGKILPV